MKVLKYYRHGIFFVIVTLLWTWAILAIPIMLGYEFKNAVTKAAYVLAGASPSAIGLIFVFSSKDKEYIKSFLIRVVRFNGIGVKLFAVIFITVPAVTIISAYLNFLLTSNMADWSLLAAYCKNPAGLIVFAIFTLIFGPLAEEIGWRGYLLDCWKNKGILVYGVTIGIIWALWHLPMFFIAGAYQNSLLTQGSLQIACFFLSTVALGVIISTISKKTGSISSAILFHFMVNFTGELIPLDTTAELIKTGIYILIALIMIYTNFQKEICNEKKREV